MNRQVAIGVATGLTLEVRALPQTPPPYASIEVTFQNAADNVRLAGTLTFRRERAMRQPRDRGAGGSSGQKQLSSVQQLAGDLVAGVSPTELEGRMREAYTSAMATMIEQERASVQGAMAGIVVLELIANGIQKR